jgi:hypothetical protein
MLDTPLFPVFQGEGRRITFAAAPIYQSLVRGCIGGGSAGAFYGLIAPVLNMEVPFYPAWWLFTGLAVASAGTLALYSLRFISFDLKERVYRRRDGSGPFGSLRRGRIDQLDALVVTARPNPFGNIAGGGPTITYRLTAYWKGNTDTPMVLAEETRVVPPGSPLNASAGPMLQLGQRVATSLQVRLFDNTMVPTA